MQFGYFLNQNNLGLAKPFGQALDERREIARHCDRTGWDSSWTTEHHFGHKGLEVCPNPTLMGVDLAAHTERIRIGQAANIITFRHPVQLAEDLAMLDHMSAGPGRSVWDAACTRATVNMNPTADVRNPEVNRALFSETLEVIRRAWTREFSSFEGEFFRFPQPGVSFSHAMSPPQPENTDPETGHITALSVVPKPFQSPHPPLWQVVDTPPSIEFAVRNDLQAMFWIPPTDAQLPRFEAYRDAASEARGAEVGLGEGVAVLRDMCVTETMAEAERLAGDGIVRYMQWVCEFRGLGNHRYPGEDLPETPGKLDMLSYEWLHPRNMLSGTPDYVAAKIHEMKEKLNLRKLLVWSSSPGVSHEAAMDSITMFTEEVMPQFVDTAEEAA